MAKNDFIKIKLSEKEKKKKEKNKRISVIILLCFFTFCAIGSSLGIFSFFGCNANVKEVKADTVNLSYEFKGSNLYFQTIGLYPNGYMDYIPSNWTSNFRFSFTGFNDPIENSYRTDIVFTSGYNEYKWSPYNIYSFAQDFQAPFLLPSDGSFSIYQKETDNDTFYHEEFLNYDFFCGFGVGADFKSRAFFRMVVKYSNQSYFDANVVKVVFGHFKFSTRDDFENYWYDNSFYPDFSWFNVKFNYIRYYDNDGDYIEFQVPHYYGVAYDDQHLFDYRVYYLEQNGQLESSDAYLQGVNKGYEQGKKDGLDEGFKKGENFAKNTWYEAGFYDGVASKNDYTFVGLLGAVVDAPIIALFGDTVLDSEGNSVRVNGLLNFELLGVNLSSFLGGLLMASLIIAVVKLLL